MMQEPLHAPSADDIAGAIMEMLNTLHVLNGVDDVPFSENVARAVERFDRPELRTELVRRLYREDAEPFAPSPAPSDRPTGNGKEATNAR